MSGLEVSDTLVTVSPPPAPPPVTTTGVPGAGSAAVVAVLGRGPLARHEVRIEVDDLGLVRGDGCFETVLARRTAGSWRLVRLGPHLDRLQRSAAILDLPAVDTRAWADLVTSAVDAYGGPGDEAAVKLLLSRGRPGGPPTALVTVEAPAAAILRQRDTGISVVTLSRGMPRDAFAAAPWLLGGAKTLSYAVNMAALREAARRGADDAIFVATDGAVLEAPTATAVWLADGILTTTPVQGSGILLGTAQVAVFEAAARTGIPTAHTWAAAEDLHRAQALWLVSSVRGMTPVTVLDGRPLPQRPDLTADLHAVAIGLAEDA